MDKALYISMTGAKHNMLAQTAHSNNLANANTTGFRADFAQARSMGVYYGEGHPTRAYAQTENPATNFVPGPLIETGRSLDIAVEGDGLIAIQDATGNEAYTRVGDLTVDVSGILRTSTGHPVLGSGGPIAIPPAEKITIGNDGTIAVQISGSGPDEIITLDRIKLVSPDWKDMEKGVDGMIRLRTGGIAEPDANVTVASGFIEGSNVNAIHEFTEVLSLSRQYEMQIKLMKTAEKNSESSSSMLRMS
jgi:flagellar basal-body rod protein FlgF